ncbi:hypothetical protein N4G58_08260 [Edwardsiella piscicida]|nr:hypothetical protein N4G58_08260 [Edwardsiella piscicida]
MISNTPPFQHILWDSATRRFSEMRISLRALSGSHGQPLLLDILSDSYLCASVSPRPAHRSPSPRSMRDTPTLSRPAGARSPRCAQAARRGIPLRPGNGSIQARFPAPSAANICWIFTQGDAARYRGEAT